MASIRLLDGVILEDSHADDSFENGLLLRAGYLWWARAYDARVRDSFLSRSSWVRPRLELLQS